MGSRSTTSAPRQGVPTSLPPAAAPRQRQLSLVPDDGRTASSGTTGPVRTELLPGAVLIEGWLDQAAQQALVSDFRRWAEPPAGLRHPRMPTGHVMSVQSVCLGLHWRPYAYAATADDVDGAPVKPLPDDLIALSRRAVADAYGTASAEAEAFAPDAAIVNLYAPGAHLGLHQDGEEPSAAPVVTISLGDTCRFRMAGVDRRTGPFTDVDLASGDLLVFGRQTRRIFHGVPKVHAGTAPDDLGLPPGRLSITVRETGLDPDQLA
jgi:DNA oxidative demethylase